MIKLIVKTREEASWLHDRLIEQADEIFKENPCDFQDNLCFVNRGNLHIVSEHMSKGLYRCDTNGCCSDCEHLGPKGCLIVDLPCRLGICVEAFKVLSGDGQRRISALKRIATSSNIPFSLWYKLDRDNRIECTLK